MLPFVRHNFVTQSVLTISNYSVCVSVLSGQDRKQHFPSAVIRPLLLTTLASAFVHLYFLFLATLSLNKCFFRKSVSKTKTLTCIFPLFYLLLVAINAIGSVIENQGKGRRQESERQFSQSLRLRVFVHGVKKKEEKHAVAKHCRITRTHTHTHFVRQRTDFFPVSYFAYASLSLSISLPLTILGCA